MKNRLHELDSLRGLAALAVLFSHFLLIFPAILDASPATSEWWLSAIIFSPIHIFWSGHESVIFFFILSGFVLMLPFLGKKKPMPYPSYLAKRILRIYPPYICAVAIAFAAKQWFYTGDIIGMSRWLNDIWAEPLNLSTVIDHVILIKSFSNCSFNPVLWSLVAEMRISIIFPAIAILIIAREKLAIGIAFFLSFLSWLLYSLHHQKILHQETDYSSIVQYIPMFIFGAILAKNRIFFINAFSSTSPRIKGLLIGLAILAYTNASWLPHYWPLDTGFVYKLLNKIAFQNLITSAGALTLICASLSVARISHILSHTGIRFLGKISYSLYLYHSICLKSAICLLHHSLPIWCILIIAFLASLLTATASYYLVELPSIRLGQRLFKSPVTTPRPLEVNPL